MADFLFHYKLLVEYPDDSFPYLEPAAADTLDSAFNPLVIAFERDVATFQHTLQNRCANILNSKKTGIKGYGYSGLVNVKVLGGQEGAVKTTAQNYFNATPVPSINQLFSSLAAQAASEAKSPLPSLVTDIAPAKAVEVLAALGPVLNPPAVTAHIGRELDLTVTAHTLAGAYGAELDVQVDSAENGSGNFTAGSSTKSDDLNSRVATHSVDTHVRLESMRLLELSTMGSVLARSQQPWKPVDPYFEIPGLDLIVKKPRPAKEVFTQSLVFLDATVVPTAADLGDGVPLEEDKIAKRNESSAQESATGHNEEFDPGCFVDKHKCHWIRLHDLYFTTMGGALLQFHNKIVNCLNSEYIGSDGTVQVALPTTDFVGSKDPAISGPCNFTDPHSLGYINPDPTSAVTVPDPSLTSPNALPQ
ncbi:MAG TPA: hypothetical protein VMD29_14100 [Terracidiphilus sp.]|nr:hypothetical protein [Terracidiphilus sp.]